MRQVAKIYDGEIDGQCVWSALLHGVVGLETNGATGPKSLLALIRKRLVKCMSRGMPWSVAWQGSELSQQEVEEIQEAVLKGIRIEDGYLCSACDPLLLAFAAAFHVDVYHDFLDTCFKFEVPDAKRIVHLRSSLGHMEHISNQDLLPVASQTLPTQGTASKAECRRRLRRHGKEKSHTEDHQDHRYQSASEVEVVNEEIDLSRVSPRCLPEELHCTVGSTNGADGSNGRANSDHTGKRRNRCQKRQGLKTDSDDMPKPTRLQRRAEKRELRCAAKHDHGSQV